MRDHSQPGGSPIAQFTVLASGSSGNASLLQVNGFGLLIDCGVGPRVLAQRLAGVGLSWQAVSACIVTHTHGDHWKALSLAHLHRLRLPLIAHPRHHRAMSVRGEYPPLEKAGLVREFTEKTRLHLTPMLSCLPVRVPHDSDPTYAFRFEGPGWALGFASDVGHATPDLVSAFTDVNLLAIEFNHDERMQRASNRPRQLINRVLGDDGHLSNSQAAEFTRRVLQTSPDLRHIVQLHLSRDCNTPDLAARAGQAILDWAGSPASVVTASQHHPTLPIPLIARPASRTTSTVRFSHQPTLPGLGS